MACEGEGKRKTPEVLYQLGVSPEVQDSIGARFEQILWRVKSAAVQGEGTSAH